MRWIRQAYAVDDGIDASRRRAGVAQLRKIGGENLGMGSAGECAFELLFRAAHDAIVDAAPFQFRRERLTDSAGGSEDGYFANRATPVAPWRTRSSAEDGASWALPH